MNAEGSPGNGGPGHPVPDGDQLPVAQQEQWWWSMTMVVILGLAVVVAVAVAAMVIDDKDAGTIAGAAFTAVGTLVAAFLGLKSTQNQANSAAVFAAHVPESRANDAIRQAQIRGQSA